MAASKPARSIGRRPFSSIGSVVIVPMSVRVFPCLAHRMDTPFLYENIECR